MKVYLASQPVDFRKGPDGLVGLVRDAGADPFSLPTKLLLRLDHCFHLAFGFGQARLQHPNMLQNVTPDPLVLCRSQSVLLRDDHAGDVIAMSTKVCEALAFGGAR